MDQFFDSGQLSQLISTNGSYPVDAFG